MVVELESLKADKAPGRPGSTSISLFPLAVIAGFIFVFSLPAPAQHDRFEGWDALLEDPFVRNPDRRSLRTFRIAESWDAEGTFRKVKDHLAAGRIERAVPLLQEMVETGSGQVFQIAADTLDGLSGLARFVGVAEIAHYLLSTLPPEGRALYETLAEEAVRTRLDRAKAEKDLETLSRIGETWSASLLGREAFSFLAACALEQGAPELAAQALKKILLFHPDADPVHLARLVQALDQSGIEEEKEQFLLSLESRKTEAFQNESFLHDLNESPPLSLINPDDWLTFGGNPGRNRPMNLIKTDGDFPLQWRRNFLNEHLTALNPFPAMADAVNMVPFQLARSGEILLVNDSLSATAYNIYTGEEVWHFKGPLEDLEDDTNYYTLEDYFPLTRFSRNNVYSAVTISPHIIAGSTVVGDTVFVNFQDKRPRREAKLLDRRVINKAIPRRALFALRRSDGAFLWAQGASDRQGDDFLSRVSISSPPLVIGDRVLCSGYLREGGINTFLLCFDRDSGRLRWKVSTGIGQQELTMFNMEYKEFTTTPLAEVGGMAILCSNLGFICAVDILSGRFCWIVEYETIELPQATRFTSSPDPRRVYWANNPPLVCGDEIIVSPLDSQFLMAFDWRTGTPRWKVHPHRLGVDLYPHIVGVHDDNVIISGRGGALALSSKDGSFVWRAAPTSDQEVTGRGALTATHLYLPVGDRLQSYDLKDGTRHRSLDLGYADEPVNLFLLGEVTAMAGPGEIALYFDAPGMLGHALARAEQGKDGPKDQAFIGDMYRLNNDLGPAITHYEKALVKAQEDQTFQGTEHDRVTACLFSARLEYGYQLLDQGDLEQAETVFRRAMDGAEDLKSSIQAGLALIDFFESTGQESMLSPVLDRLEKEWGGFFFDFSGFEQGLGETAVAFYAMVKRARIARSAGDNPGELKALQGLLARYPMEAISGVPVRQFAGERIAELIEESGRTIYTEYDREAESLFAEALAGEGIGRLAQIHERFPNARISGQVALETALRQLEAGRLQSVYQVLGEFLGSQKESEEIPYALFLMARTAALEGNRELVEFLKRRLLKDYAQAIPPRGPQKPYAELMQELDVDSDEAPAVWPPSYSLPRDEPLVQKIRFSSGRNHLIEAEGIPPAFMNGKALIELETESQITLFDYQRMETVWTQDVGRFRTRLRGGDLLLLYHLNDLLIVVFESRVAALALQTGEFLWERDPGGIVLDTDVTGGLISLLSVPMLGETFLEKMSALTLNPVSGEPLWKKTMNYTPRARFFPAHDTLCVYGLNTHRRPAILMIDPVTGALNAEVVLYDKSLLPMPFRSPQGMLLGMAHHQDRNAGQQGMRTKYLEAYDTANGQPIWSVNLQRWIMSPADCMLADDRIVVFTKDQFEFRGRNTILFLDLETGEVADYLMPGNEELLKPDGNILPGNELFLRAGRSRRTLSLSVFDTGAMDFSFKDQRFLVGDASTLDTQVRDAIYTNEGVVIPLDFTVNRGGQGMLWSQVLVVAGDGLLLSVLDLIWEGEDRIPLSAVEYYPVEVNLRRDALLVLKRSELYVVQEQTAGG